MKKAFFAVATLSLLLAACGSAAPPEPVEIRLDMSEYAFGPNEIELRVGQEVSFVLANVGQLEHELMIGRDVDTQDGKASGYEIDFFAAGDVEPVLVLEMDEHDDGEEHDEDAMDEHSDHEGFMAMLEPGSPTATLSFTVSEGMLGEWEMGCFLLDGVHYTSGMVGTLTVTK